MNFLNGRLIVIAIAAFALTAGAYAQSPREELTQMVQQLQKAPTDNALRERIIKLALTLKPPPALPTEAERRMVRGAAAFNGATSLADYRAAANEFEQATLAAPWYGDAYYNLGVAQHKAEDYDAALRSLKLAVLASPGSKDAEKLSYAVEFRKEKAAKANSPEVRAAKEKETEQRFIASLEGARYVCPEWKPTSFYSDQRPDVRSRGEIEVRNGKLRGANVTTWVSPRGLSDSPALHVGRRAHWFSEISLQGRVNTVPDHWGEMRFEIHDDRLVVTGSERSNKPPGPCRRQ
jgi:tetratricopeptide (TPR) repeat protein